MTSPKQKTLVRSLRVELARLEQVMKDAELARSPVLYCKARHRRDRLAAVLYDYE